MKFTQKHIDELHLKGFDINQTHCDENWIEKKHNVKKADWRFFNKLLADNNIPFRIEYWRGDGDKGRSKLIFIKKNYFDLDIKFPYTSIELITLNILGVPFGSPL